MKNISATNGTSRIETFRMADFATGDSMPVTIGVLSTLTPGDRR